MSIEDLLTLEGPLAETVPLFEPNTWRHSDEITQERVTNNGLRNYWLFTADMAMYRIVNDRLMFGLARGQANLIFKNIPQSTNQLGEKGYYIITKSLIDSVVNSTDFFEVDMRELGLKYKDTEEAYFDFDITKYDTTLNAAQRKVAERAYGSMNKGIDSKASDFDNAMRIFRDENEMGASVNVLTRVFVLNPGYVSRTVPKKEAIARACWLDQLIAMPSDFYANKGEDPWGNLRGVLKAGQRSALKEVGECGMLKL